MKCARCEAPVDDLVAILSHGKNKLYFKCHRCGRLTQKSNVEVK